MSSFEIGPEHVRRTTYELAPLARAIILRSMEPSITFDPKYDFHTQWHDHKLNTVTLMSRSVDGPYTLTRSLLAGSGQDSMIFRADSEAITVSLDPSTDLLEFDIAQLPLDVEKILLLHSGARDTMPRESTRLVDEEDFDEIGALLAAQHILGDRVAYPRHSRELQGELLDPVFDDISSDIDDGKRTTISSLLNLAAKAQPTKRSVIHSKLHEISKSTIFPTRQTKLFSYQLEYLLRTSEPYVRVPPQKPQTNTTNSES